MNTAVFRQGSWMVTVPLTAIAVAYLTLAWLPGRRAIQTILDQVEMKRQLVAQATELPAMLIAAGRQLDEAESAVAQWEETSLRKKHLSVLYGKVNALAKDAGLAIARFDPQPLVLHEKIHEIPLAIGCSGAFAQVHDFLRKVERLPATIWVESMKIEKIVMDAKDVQCEMDLVVFSNNP